MFTSLLLKMIFLFGLIFIGYVLAKGKFVPNNTEQVLSKLETLIFVPCLVMGAFIADFSIENLAVVWNLLVVSLIVFIIAFPTGFILARFIFKDKYLRNIGTYGLIFSNFGFMGNAIMSSGVFGDIFFEYTIFQFPFWLAIYGWAVPFLLMDKTEGSSKLKSTLKNFLNPMFICMIIGMVIGLLNLKTYIPTPINELINVLGSCMSPLAMILTGMTIGRLRILKLLKKYKIYIITIFRLLIIPLTFIAIVWLFNLELYLGKTALLCTLCMLSMPLGLNTIVIPASFGKDTSDAAGMSLVSHILSLISIPIVFELLLTII